MRIVHSGIWQRRGTNGECSTENGEEKPGCLSRACLCTSHEVATFCDNRNRVFLDGGGFLVVGEFDVAY